MTEPADITAVAAPTARFIASWNARVGAKPAAAIALGLLALCAPGWLQLQWNDDVRSLTGRPAGLLQQDARIRSLTGVEIAPRFFVVEAATPESTLRAEEQLTTRLRSLVEKLTPVEVSCIGIISCRI